MGTESVGVAGRPYVLCTLIGTVGERGGVRNPPLGSKPIGR